MHWGIVVRRPLRWWVALLASVLSIAALVAVEAAPARAAASTFTATADTQIQEANPSMNYGTSTALRVDGGSDPDVQTFLRFSVSGLSGTIQSATLRLYATSATANGPSVFTPAATWTETGLTWSNRPALVGAGVGKVTTISTGTWAAFDVTSLVTGTGTFDLVLAGTSTDGVDFQSREATNKPQLVVTTGTTSGDTSPPTPPGTLTASAASASRVDLQWGASTDDSGVTGYEIFRDSALLTTVGAVTTFADTTVSGSTSYAYQVRAMDAAGNRSDPSNTAGVTTPPASTTTTTFTPTADARVSEAKPSTNFGTSKILRVDAGTDPDVETYLRFSVSGLPGSIQNATLRLYVTAATVDGPAVFVPSGSWTETGITWNTRPSRTGSGVADAGALAVGTWATFDVTSLVTGSGAVDLVLAGTSTDGVDWDSREGTNKPQLVVTTNPDGTNPTPPTGVQAAAVSATRVDLAWTAGADDVGVTGYEIYRDQSLLATIGALTSYSDTTAKPQTSYTYTLRARDAAGNRSAMSDPSNQATTPADTTKPSAPTNLSATAGGTTRIDLSWTAATDDVGVTNYEIYRGGSLLTTVGAVTTHADTTVLSGVTYTYEVRALDAAGNVSDASNTASASTTDSQLPSAPSSLSAAAVAATRIDLSWSASTDNIAVTNYEIFRDGTLLTMVGAVTSYSDTTALPGTSYSYQVRAVDLSGNRSSFSPTASATTPQQTATFTPAADAKVDESTPATNYATSALRVDFGSGANVESDLSFAVSGMSGTVRQATLRLWATSGTIDGPAVYPTTTDWTETGITWTNKPARTGPAVADVAGISTGTWVDLDVTRLITGNGTFAFTLAGISTDGVDFTSREGTNKPQLVVTTGPADTQPPAAPTGLTATSGSPYQVDLAWNAATDDIAVTSYLVFRGPTQMAVLDANQLTYSDTTVSPNTSYTYTVKARDAAGNTSAASGPASVTTPTSGSSSPVIAAAGDIACDTSDANYNGGLGTSTACRQLYTSNLLVSGGFAAVLPLGDEQYNSGSLSQFNLSYDPTWGRVKSISRPAVGNHEYGQSGASGYFTYYGSLAGDPSTGYYSFDIGSWHVVALNSNCTKITGGCDVGSPQETWLRNDLSAHPALCTIAMSHHARWSSGHDGDNAFMQPLWQDLYDAGVEVLLSGHSHDYERYARQDGAGNLDNTRGVRQFVVGTGGAFFTGFGTIDANSQVHNNTTFGILKMTLRSTGYDWQFVPEAGKTFTDSGTTSCQ